MKCKLFHNNRVTIKTMSYGMETLSVSSQNNRTSWRILVRRDDPADYPIKLNGESVPTPRVFGMYNPPNIGCLILREITRSRTWSYSYTCYLVRYS